MTIPAFDIDWVKIGPLIGAIAVFFAAILAALFAYLNAEIQKSLKRKDIYRLLKAGITSLQRHCIYSSQEINLSKNIDISNLRMAKYKDGNMLLLGTKETYLLNENVCQDVMRIFLISRNNDIHIDEMVSDLRAGKVQPNDGKVRLKRISRRLAHTSSQASEVLSNIDDYIKNPRKYSRSIITKEMPK